MNKKELGTIGEKEVSKFLEKQGYFVIAKNFNCKFGEIDIIATDQNELVFIEVKTRCSKKYGEARDSVDIYKKKHIKRAATFFVSKNRLENKFIRFDVIEVYLRGDKIFINHIKNTLW